MVSAVIRVGKKTLYYENSIVGIWPTEYFSDGQQIDEIICVRFLLGLLLKLDSTSSSCPSP